MASLRIALANLGYPASPDDSVGRVERAIAQAADAHVAIVCFPECYVPGYRRLGHDPGAVTAAWLERAWDAIAAAAGRARVAVVLGTERIVDQRLCASVLVIDRDGTRLGFQDKVQIDPTEEGVYASAATGRRVFEVAGTTIGVVICHEGWRYPETVRWAARHGARVVFHPHFGEREVGFPAPTTFGETANTFHEKAMLCRAAENTCYFASVNYASPGSSTTSAIAQPDGTLLGYQPYGVDGVFVADVDLSGATLELARRYRPLS